MNLDYHAENLRAFFHENEVISKEDGIYSITRSINSEDTSFSPIEKFIKKNKPKTLYYFYPSEFSSEWLMDEILHNNESRKKIESILLENNTQLKLIISSTNSDLYKEINENPKLICNFEILYWPTFILYMSFEMMFDRCFSDKNKNTNLLVNTVIPNFQKLYVNYNNKPRIHRCMMMDYLVKNNLFEYGFNSWNQKQFLNNNMGSNADVGIRGEETYKFKYWSEKPLSIDGYSDPTKKFTDEHSTWLYNPKSFMALVGETAYGISPITEKTYRCLLQQEPFLAFGGINQNTNLISLGFKLYDEIFDYSFEKSPNLEDRIQGVIDNLNKIKDEDYQKLYDMIKPKLEFNQNHAIDILKNDIYCPKELLDVVKKYKNN
jgi:hypothetical protein